MNAITMPAKPASSGCSCGAAKTGAACSSGCAGASCSTATLVRPRFFAGQLLTEDDLQSLEDYVTAKNRLHNSRLFGAGVVCGLEVLCHPCGGGKVLVQPGYALDCCGNDIVLACATELDINAMIRDLRRDQLGGYDCGDPCSGKVSTTAGGQATGNTLASGTAGAAGAAAAATSVARDYCLYVSYCEEESDPVSPYAVDEPCSPQSCEPSRVREGLVFKLRCPVAPAPPSDFLAAVESCFRDLVGIEKISLDTMELLNPAMVGRAIVDLATERKQTFDALRSELLDVIDRSPHPVSCKLRDQVVALKAPTASTGDGTPRMMEEAGRTGPYAELGRIFVEVYKECICMAVIPPCPSCDDTDVLLACLTVQDCDVVDICNLSRQFVLSPAALRYWLGWERLEQHLEKFCCPDLVCPTAPSLPPLRDTAERLVMTPTASPTPPGTPSTGVPPATPTTTAPPATPVMPPPPTPTGTTPAQPRTLVPSTLLGLPTDVTQPAQLVGNIFGILTALQTPGSASATRLATIRDTLGMLGTSTTPPPSATDLAKALDDANTRIATLQAKLDSFTTALPAASTAKTLSDVAGAVAALQKSADAATTTLKTTGDSLAALQAKFDGFATALPAASTAKTLQDVAGSVASLQKGADANTAALKSTGDSVAALKTRLDGVVGTLPSADTLKTLTEASGTIGSLSQQITALQGQVAALAKKPAPKKPPAGGGGGPNG